MIDISKIFFPNNLALNNSIRDLSELIVFSYQSIDDFITSEISFYDKKFMVYNTTHL